MNGWSRTFGMMVASVTLLAAAACSDRDTPLEPAAPDPGGEGPLVEEAGSKPGADRRESSLEESVPAGSWVAPEYSVQTGEEWGLLIKNGPFFSPGLAQAYRERCYDDTIPTPECTALRSLVVADVTLALELIERSRDQRGAAEALEALGLAEDPLILVAALRVLGRFPDTPGIADATLPLLFESPYLQVQQLAALVLSSNPDPTLAAVGSDWNGGHSGLSIEGAYQEYPDFAPHYAGMGFPDYPDAEWFSPADSDRSVGWWTTDDLATVTAWLTEQLGTEGLGYRAWAERLSQESMAVFQAIDPAKQAEMQRLTEEWVKTQNMAVLEQLTKLQEEMYAPVEAAGEKAEQGVAKLGPPNTAEALEQVRYFVAEERDGRTARLVVAYPLAALGRTVIQHAWSLADYASAWPQPESGVPVE